MPSTNFTALPDTSRVYVFATSRQLSAPEGTRLLEQVDAFIAGWQSHQDPVTAARDWRYDQFLLIGVDERSTSLSGCSIDAMTRIFKAMENQLGVSLLDSSAVYYRDAGTIRRASREEFRALARDGRVTPDTIVFNNTVSRLSDLDHAWEIPFRNSWHAKAFPLPSSVGSDNK
jgi:hypothetical protein